MRNVLVVISGPSGVGKGTIAKKIIERNPSVSLSISCTTREKRRGEKDGVHYFFIDKPSFEEKIKNGGLLEYSKHFENYYGTPKDFVEDKLKTSDVILEIDVNGGLNVKKEFSETVLIMILPPSIEELKNRLLKRSTETEEQIKTRMQRIEYELEKQKYYDYALINEDLNETVKAVEDIINKEKNKI